MDELIMNMIEKVARAIYGKIDINCGEIDPFGNWEEGTNDYKEKYKIIAKAAIAAMREPSEDAIVAGAMIMPDYDPGNDDMLRCWQACIDAVLEEE